MTDKKEGELMNRLTAADVSEDVLARNPGLAAELQGANPSKYKNVKTLANGMTFQSGREAVRIGELILAEQHHAIFGLRLQVRFPLPGKSVYVADASFLRLENGVLTPVVLDVKGFKTRMYRLKKKLFRDTYGIDIEEA